MSVIDSNNDAAPKPSDKLTLQLTRRTRDAIVKILDDEMTEEMNWKPPASESGQYLDAVRRIGKYKYLIQQLTELGR